MNLAEQIRAEVGTPPPASFDLNTLIEQTLDDRVRNRRLGIGAATIIGIAVAATVALALVQPRVVNPPAVSPAGSPPAPLPTRSWPALPPPTGVSPGQDATLARIGPGLGVPDGTHFVFTDLGGTYKIIQAAWGSPAGSWGGISLSGAADTSTVDYSCEFVVNCVEVTGDDGSMTYVAGPIVAPAPDNTPIASSGPEDLMSAVERARTMSPTDPAAKTYAVTNFVWSYHPDGTFVFISIAADHTPPDLTIATLVAAGQAFSSTS